jgi:hypothetical protein
MRFMKMMAAILALGLVLPPTAELAMAGESGVRETASAKKKQERSAKKPKKGKKEKAAKSGSKKKEKKTVRAKGQDKKKVNRTGQAGKSQKGKRNQKSKRKGASTHPSHAPQDAWDPAGNFDIPDELKDDLPSPNTGKLRN